MDSVEFIQYFREEAMDFELPPLWSDDLILRYLDEAQNRFCRETEGIEDSSSPLCTIPVAAGQALVQLDPRILKLREAVVAESGRSLTLRSVESTHGDGRPHDGEPRALVIGLGQGKARLTPVPTEPVTLQLSVFRMPLNPIKQLGDTTEVDDRYIPTLLLFALYRAYTRPDPDTADRARAEQFLQIFLAECAAAKREQGRVRKPNGVAMFSW